MPLDSHTFPILEFLPQILNSLQKNPITVVEAPPGTGKTTVLPLALWEELQKTSNLKIGILEPRRIAAKNAAKQMAFHLGEPIGQQIGYRIRHETKVSAKTKIETMTEGILTRICRKDPSLSEFQLVVFDEFHERNIESDFCFALVRHMQTLFRNDLKIIILSATLQGLDVSRLGSFDWIKIPAPTHPLEVVYLGDSKQSPVTRLSELLPKLDSKINGDILVFLSGKKEIQNLKSNLETLPHFTEKFSILPLFGELDLKEQDLVFQKDLKDRKKIILATNIAESSVTIPGVRIVFDSGKQKIFEYDSEFGIGKLKRTNISISSIQQRSGRAAREGAGIVYRLWSKAEETSFLDRSIPEILRGNFERFILEAKSIGEDLTKLPLLDPPHSFAHQRAIWRLKLLGCLDENENLTDLGKTVLEFPIPIRYAVALCYLPASLYDLIPDFIILAESSETKSTEAEEFTFLGPGRRLNDWQTKTESQVMSLLQELSPNFPSPSIHKQNAEIIALCQGFPDRVARKKENGKSEYLLSNGKTVHLSTSSFLLPQYMITLETFELSGRIFVPKFISLDPYPWREYLQSHMKEVSSVVWEEPKSGTIQLVSKTDLKLGELVLETKENQSPDKEQFFQFALNHFRSVDLEREFQKDENFYPLLQRVRFLQKQGILDCETDVNRLSEILEEWLGPFLHFSKPKWNPTEVSLAEALKSFWTPSWLLITGQEAPDTLLLPTGNRVKIHYQSEEPEVFIKLQELFGVKNLPKLARGKISIKIHLLSPAKRPVQVTKDLESFWNSMYFEVRKELKGRYPKHPWPDEPWKAEPTARTNQRSRS